MTNSEVITKRRATSEIAPAPTDWSRIRFTLSVGIYGAAVGISAVLVNFLSQIESPDIIQHMQISQSLLFGMAGALGGFVTTAPVAYGLFGNMRVFGPNRKREPRTLKYWIVLGIGYGLILPLVIGAVLIPISFNLLDFTTGNVTVPGLAQKSFDILLLAPSLGLVLGIRLLFTTFVFGLLIGPGGWLIDRFNASDDVMTAKYGPWVVSGVLSLLIIAFIAFGSVSFLSKLG